MGKTFKDSAYMIKSVNKRTKTTRRAKLQPYDRKSFKSMRAVSKLICNRKLKATTLNLIKNDCPLQCNKQHCDVCQFRDNNSERTQTKAVTVSAPSPEAYGRELYY